MTNREAVIWLINVTADIGKAEHRDLWHYEQALSEIKEMLESQPEKEIPKRPYTSVIPYPYRTDVTVVQCPSCKRRLRTRRTMAKGDKYCPECGQAIDWSGIDG